MSSGRFDSVINSEKTVIVDFYADWCAPCKMMDPILRSIKDDLKDSVKVIKVNVDRNPFIATRFSVQSIPTTIIFKNGKLFWKGIGVKSKEEIKSALNQ